MCTSLVHLPAVSLPDLCYLTCTLLTVPNTVHAWWSYRLARLLCPQVKHDVLQAVVMVMLVVRLLQRLSFQARITVITTAFTRSLPDVTAFICKSPAHVLDWYCCAKLDNA
jgi:hypothetical protein